MTYLGTHEPLPHGWCRHRWPSRQTRDVICACSEGFDIGRAPLIEAAKAAVRLIEEAPFAHRKLTDAQVVLMDALAATPYSKKIAS